MNNLTSVDDPSRTPLLVEVVSDLICPWCYIGKRRLERAAQLMEPKRLHVVWKPLQLNPDMPGEGMNRREYRTRKFGSWERSQALDAEVVIAGNSVGIDFNYDKIDRTPNTLAAHKLLWRAAEQHCQERLAEKLFSAYFVEGRDIGDPWELTEIGIAAGLTPLHIAKALSAEAVGIAVAREEDAARCAGIRAVPTIVVNGKVLGSAAQSEQMLAAVLDKAFAEASGPSCSNTGCVIV